MPRYQYARDTVDSTLLSGVHGRERREERGIEKIDLQRARRYGMAELQRNGRIRYTYGGVVFIYCPRKNREVTSYPSCDLSNESSGTRFTTPIMLSKAEFESEEKRAESESVHLQLTSLMNLNDAMRTLWKSHSVLVVDMSGSMRRDDVNGARCRSDGVWMALARDYVKNPLEKGEREHLDLISIIIMKEDAEIIIQHEPTTWVLYDKLIDMREWSNLRPSGPGNYLPAIDQAEKLLTSNSNAGCALSLLFFSDGRPSDPKSDRPLIVERMGNLASKFGRRLSLACIGMAEESEDFSTLASMLEEAKQFGAQCSFGKPSLDTDSLSNIITSLASSLTTSKTEMTELVTGKTKHVRNDVTREKQGTPDHIGSWTFYSGYGNERYVKRIWSWNYRPRNDFVEIIDTRCSKCGDDVAPYCCSHCESYRLCNGCRHRDPNFHFHQNRLNNRRQSQCTLLMTRKVTGASVIKEVTSFSIAVKDKIFGEGAERIVRKVRFTNSYGQFIGPTMVAKESRFIESCGGSYDEQMDYHSEFMRTQDIANNFAKKFNEGLKQIESHFDPRYASWLRKLPRINFLEPVVVEVWHDGKEKNILVEKFLEGEYKKFNSNMGYVEKEVQDLVGRLNNLALGGSGRPSEIGGNFDNLGAIEEGSEDESDEEDDEIFDSKKAAPHPGEYTDVQDAYFPQAFSHFTYEKSKGCLMVVDLQGVFSIASDGTKCYELTDPVIHKHRKKRKESLKTWSFGRTDRGEKGMKAFFETHTCTDVCRLLGLKNMKT